MILNIQGLTKKFGANTAVDNATFTLDAPQMIGVIGRSGAGKSTMLRMINRLTDEPIASLDPMNAQIVMDALRDIHERDGRTTIANLHKMVNKGMLDMNDLTLIWQSPLIPNGPTVMRSSLPDDIRDKVRASVLAMPQDDPECFRNTQHGDLKGFKEVTSEFYATIIAACRYVLEQSNCPPELAHPLDRGVRFSMRHGVLKMSELLATANITAQYEIAERRRRFYTGLMLMRIAPNKIEGRPHIYVRFIATKSKLTLHSYATGWENFWFDDASALHGTRLWQAIGLTFSDERIDPVQSNLSLVTSEIWTNNEWRHGQVMHAMMITVLMAFCGTLLAAITALPLNFMAARNINPLWLMRGMVKRVFDFLRGVDALIWSLIFIRAFGLGPLAGILGAAGGHSGAVVHRHRHLWQPTASLDAANRRTVLALIEEAKARGAAIIGIFHGQAARARVCDREVDVSAFTPKAA